MKEIEKYLLEYFNDWNLSDHEKDELAVICKSAATQVAPFYKLMQKMAENPELRESIIDTIDETLTENKNDIKTDT